MKTLNKLKNFFEAKEKLEHLFGEEKHISKRRQRNSSHKTRFIKYEDLNL